MRCNLAHVPDHGLTRIEVGRTDQQPAMTHRVLIGHPLQHFWRNGFGNQVGQRGRIAQAIRKPDRCVRALAHHILVADLGVEPLEHRVISRAEKR